MAVLRRNRRWDLFRLCNLGRRVGLDIHVDPVVLGRVTSWGLKLSPQGVQKYFLRGPRHTRPRQLVFRVH
jgi:hypothetical protein